MSAPVSSLLPVRTRIDGERKHVADGAAQVTSQKMHLFDLPQEVRDKIYSYLLDTQAVRFWSRSQYKRQLFDGETFVLRRSPWEFDATVLRVNRRLHQEASTLFYKSNLFLRVALFTPIVQFAEILLEEIASHVTFHGTNPVLLEQCVQHSVDVAISINQSDMKRSQFMIPFTSLDSMVVFLSTLCNVANADHAPFSNIDIHVRNMYGLGDDVIQQCLLEPWRKIFNIPSVSIAWDSSPPGYIDALQRDMMQKTFDAEAWLLSVTNLKDNGIKAFDHGSLEASINYFKQALSAIKSVYGDKPGSRRAELTSKGDEFSRAVSRIQFESELNISMAWVNLEDCFDEARKAATNAFRISQDDLNEVEARHYPLHNIAWYEDADRATAMFCLGSADMAEGAFESAHTSFEEAQRLNPHDPGINRAVAQARRRLDERA